LREGGPQLQRSEDDDDDEGRGAGEGLVGGIGRVVRKILINVASWSELSANSCSTSSKK
jgi:hypothetical protein